MRIYMDGHLSSKQETFLPSVLWFANEKCDENDSLSENSVCLECHWCDAGVSEDGMSFSTRWKDVDIRYIDENGEEIETEDFTVDLFMDLVKEKELRLVNMEANFDSDVNVLITELVIVDVEKRIEFDTNLIDEIEFIV